MNNKITTRQQCHSACLFLHRICVILYRNDCCRSTAILLLVSFSGPRLQLHPCKSSRWQYLVSSEYHPKAMKYFACRTFFSWPKYVFSLSNITWLFCVCRLSICVLIHTYILNASRRYHISLFRSAHKCFVHI